jgi:hypothetical protein
MTLGELALSRVVSRFRRAVAESSTYLPIAPLGTVGSWLVRLPGMRPHAPKRNVIIGLVYLYLGSVLTAIGTV